MSRDAVPAVRENAQLAADRSGFNCVNDTKLTKMDEAGSADRVNAPAFR